MNTFLSFQIFLCLTCVSLSSGILIDELQAFWEMKQSDSHGQCIWYGECGENPIGKLNCAYNGPPKPLINTTAIGILKAFCPDMVSGKQPLTCCDTDQIITFQKTYKILEDFFRRCEACFFNFMNLFCDLVCSPNQSRFVNANVTTNKKVVSSVSYYVSNDYSYRMFNSCFDVKMPSANERALSLFCGRPGGQCTPKTLFDYMGSKDNGHQPFDIFFKITNQNVHVGDKTFVPMNHTTVSCKDICSCHDCNATKCRPSPKPRPCPNGSCFDGKIRSIFRQEQLVITRPRNHTHISYFTPTAVVKEINFTSLFDRQFLHMLLDFQQSIHNITARFENESIQLRDICFRPQGHQSKESGSNGCSITSILEYWQSNHTRIDELKMDISGWFVMGDYLSHFLMCSTNPSVYDKTMNMSCKSSTNEILYPNTVLAGYEEPQYNSSIAFVITYLVNNYQDDRMNDMARAWEVEFRDYVMNFSSPNMTVSYATQN